MPSCGWRPCAMPHDEPDFRRDIARFVADELGPGARIGVDTVDDAVEVFGRYRLKPPPDFVAAARALAIFEGTLRTLAPSFDLLEESRGLAREQITDQLRPGKLRDLAAKELLGVVSAARRLPRRVDRIGEAIETGRFTGEHPALRGQPRPAYCVIRPEPSSSSCVRRS